MRAALRAALAAVALAAVLAVPAGAEERVLTREQAVLIARLAYGSGDIALANAIARRLVQADPKDAEALLILAATEPVLGNPVAGRMAGRAAWSTLRAKDAPDGLQYEAARYTAQAAWVEGNSVVAQYWLRRALDVAPNEAALQRTQDDIAWLRARTPLQFDLDLSVVPMSNLNNGATGGLLTIDDSFVVGVLSPEAQELPGVRATVDARVGYLLPWGGAALQTIVGARVFGTWNRFSPEAEPGTLQASDLNRRLVEATLTGVFTLPGTDLPMSLTFAGGKSWIGGVEQGTHLRGEARLVALASASNTTWFTGTVERQADPAGPLDGYAIRVDGRQMFDFEGSLLYGLGYMAGDGPSVNNRYEQVDASLGFELPPFADWTDISFDLYGSWRNYDQFSLGPFYVTDGRTDESWGLAANFDLNTLGMMGYVPRLTIAKTQTDSNISRFSTRQLSVSFNIQSSF